MSHSPDPNQNIEQQIDEIERLFEEGQTAAAANLIEALVSEARISTLKRFSHVPPPHDEEWSPEFQKGVEHGVRISQEKLRFEIQRLKKQTPPTPNGDEQGALARPSDEK